MKRLRAISTVAAAALIALGAAACGDDDSDDSAETEERSFTRSDLPGLVTARSERPDGTKVLESGAGVFEKEAD